MAQFDVFRNPRVGLYPLLLDVQADLLSQLATRVVVPLAKRDRYPATALARATPTASIAGIEYVLVVPLLASIPKTALGKPVGSLTSRRADIIAALDLLLTGT
jgi:toxin CcdB